jgi:hypothetical protein
MKKISIVQSSIRVPVVLLIVIAIMASVPILYTTAQEQPGATTTGAANATTDTAASLAGIVNSVAVIVGVIVPLIISGAAYVKSKSQDPRIQEAADTATNVGRISTAIANKALENKQHIKELLEVGLALTPADAKRILDQNRERIAQLNREIQATEAQIKRLVPYIPGQANADTIPDLPREAPPIPPAPPRGTPS